MKKNAKQYLHYIDSGGKKPVIFFLHFFGGSSRAWETVIALLKDSFRCIAVDLQGFGQSASNKYFSVKEHALSVNDLAESLGIKGCVLVGHSMGGKIALAAAAASSTIKGLILVAPSPPSPEPFKRGGRVALRNAFGKEEKLRASLRAASGRKPAAEIFEQAVADNLRASEAAWKGWVDRGSREDISSVLKDIHCPVMILSGEKDKKLPTAFLEKAVGKKLPVSSMKEIRSVGHLIPLEAPRETAIVVKKFLARF